MFRCLLKGCGFICASCLLSQDPRSSQRTGCQYAASLSGQPPWPCCIMRSHDSQPRLPPRSVFRAQVLLPVIQALHWCTREGTSDGGERNFTGLIITVASRRVTADIIACVETTQLQQRSMNTRFLCRGSNSDVVTTTSPSSYKGSRLPVRLSEEGFHMDTSENPCPASQA